jgi:hypothetical protein
MGRLCISRRVAALGWVGTGVMTLAGLAFLFS